MRKFLFVLSCILMALPLSAQEEGTGEIFKVVEEMPRFPGCEGASTDPKEVKDCASRKMLEFIYQNIQYPDSARIKGLEGTVVIRFVVTEQGEVENAEVIKDIGGGCGEEALRVVNLMKTMTEKWIPGQQQGKAVKVYFNLPVKFRLEAPKGPQEFFMIGPDTIWLVTETPVQFVGEEGQTVDDYIQQTLYYPEEGLADCLIGEIDIQMLVASDGRVTILDMADYSGLDIDFQYEAVAWVRRSSGKWEPATQGGKKVHSAFWQRLILAPGTEDCAGRISQYEEAKQLMEEGIILSADTSQLTMAFAKWDQAIELFPNNTEMLAVRGQAYMQQGDFENACADIRKASKILWSEWFNSLLGVLCIE